MAALPAEFAWLGREIGPRILLEALKLYGTVETPGDASNPKILDWAKEVGSGIKDIYTNDEIPWCGLFVAVCAVRSRWDVPKNPLWALSWGEWGRAVIRPMLGDILVFRRNGGGHVGIYVGEDSSRYYVLGGNQGDAVTIIPIDKARLVTARRCPWRIAQPSNIRVIELKTNQKASSNER